MVDAVVVRCLGCLAPCIFGCYLAVGMLLRYLRDAFVHRFRFLLLVLVRVERHHFHHGGVGVFRGHFPRYLQDGAVYLDAEEILRLAGECQ